MRSMQEIKAVGKAAFQENYWNCVLASLLVSAVTAALGFIARGQAAGETIAEGTTDVTVSVTSGGSGLLSFLIVGPLTVGLCYFFIKNVLGERDGLDVTTPFKEAFNNYPRKLGGTFLMELFIILWSLLFVIPGIIKGFAYSMTSYILADCPNVGARDALKLSERIMKGHKIEYFMLFLSFLGWLLLSAFTAGILYVFYVGPYMSSTFAEYYLEVTEDALRNGVVTQGQLEGTEAV